MKVNFVERLTLSIVVSMILFGVSFTFLTGMTTAVNGIATFYGAVPVPFAQPWWELLLSFSVAFIPIAIAIWDHKHATKTETS